MHGDVWFARGKETYFSDDVGPAGTGGRLVHEALDRGGGVVGAVVEIFEVIERGWACKREAEKYEEEHEHNLQRWVDLNERS